jgi:SAM-dependent methyltransferase
MSFKKNLSLFSLRVYPSFLCASVFLLLLLILQLLPLQKGLLLQKIITMQHSTDVMGLAAADYLAGITNGKIKVKSNIVEDDVIPVPYLFRTFDKMPPVEQKALQLCRGRVLDVGSGTGSHALWLQQQGYDVTALEMSPGLCEVMQQRGVNQLVEADFFTWHPQGQFDTLLMLMNGIGLVGKLDRLPEFYQRAKQLLAPGGQLLIDSSDIAYLFDDEETQDLPETFDHYYGEIQYQMIYKQAKTSRFHWLFIDPYMLAQTAEDNGWQCNILSQGENGEYLARLML